MPCHFENELLKSTVVEAGLRYETGKESNVHGNRVNKSDFFGGMRPIV